MLCCAALCVCWRCHVLIGSSTGVIRKEKIAKKTVRGEKISEEIIKTRTPALNSTWYLVLRMIPGGIMCFKERAAVPLRGRRTPPATLAQGRMLLIHVKGAERRGPWFGADSDSITPSATCAELTALRCPALRCVLIGDVTFSSTERV